MPVFDLSTFGIACLDFLLDNTVIFGAVLCAAVIVVARCLFEGGVR